MSRFIHSTSLRLPDNSIERHTTWLEIFFDLIAAIIVVQISDRLSNNLTPLGIFYCIALFIPTFWMWVSYTIFAARFDNNDAIHWGMTFVTMFAGVIMAIQIPTALEEGANVFAIGFIISQIALILLYTRAFFDKSTPKSITLFYLSCFSIAITCWIISLFFPPLIKFSLWALGMSIYLIMPWIGRKRILSKAPLDTVYVPERFGAFTIIILGQTIAAVVFGLESASWHPTAIITSMMAFILATLIWGQYYRFIRRADYKCTFGSGQPYIYAHIPLIIGLIIIGVCAKEFIIGSTHIEEYISHLFCLAIILYLSSFLLLQYITIRKFKMRGLSYLGGITALLLLFFVYPLSPVLLISGVALIFLALLAIQFELGAQKS